MFYFTLLNITIYTFKSVIISLELHYKNDS